MKLHGWHAQTKGTIEGPPRVPFYIGLTREVAEAYAEDDPPLEIVEVEYEAENPLVVTDGRELIPLFDGAPRIVPFHPNLTGHAAQRAVDAGHDAIVLTQEAFDGDEVSWSWAAGTYGDPQAVLLNADRIVVVG